jgi:glycosyltransferase involved in cell wall biosynthesis
MKTKIGYLCSSVSWGGLEMNQLRNAGWMQARGHEVLLLCREGAPIAQKAAAQGIPLLFIQKHRKYYDFKAGKQLAQLLKGQHVSHLLLRDTRDMSVAAIAKRAMSGKLHLSYFMEMQLGVSKKNVLHTLRFRHFDLWSCPLNWLATQVETMTRFDSEKIRVIPSGLELQPFLDGPSVEAARDLLDLPQDKKILGLIGRFDPQKGQLLLLEALKQVADPEVCICLLGEPTRGEGMAYFGQIESIIAENNWENRVFIRPFREDIPTFYKAIDAFVMASKAETFGMVTIESMASGTPVIGSNAGGTPEILKFGEAGYLFEPLNATSLAESITQFLQEPHAFAPEMLVESAQVYDHRQVCQQVEKALEI